MKRSVIRCRKPRVEVHPAFEPRFDDLFERVEIEDPSIAPIDREIQAELDDLCELGVPHLYLVR